MIVKAVLDILYEGTKGKCTTGDRFLESLETFKDCLNEDILNSKIKRAIKNRSSYGTLPLIIEKY